MKYLKRFILLILSFFRKKKPKQKPPQPHIMEKREDHFYYTPTQIPIKERVLHKKDRLLKSFRRKKT